MAWFTNGKIASRGSWIAKYHFLQSQKKSKYGIVFIMISYAREGRCEESKNCKRLKKGSLLKIT